MFVLEPELVKKILQSEFGYSSIEATAFVRDFPLIHDELAQALERWLQDRIVPDLDVFGLPIKEYMQNRRAHFLMAVKDLNRLYDQDISPEQRDRLIEILRNPFIRW